MSVYVDAKRKESKTAGPLRLKLVLSNMVADTLEELHEAADRIGVASVFFKVSPLGIPHYQIAESMRKHALGFATELNEEQMAEFIQKFKKKHNLGG